MGAERRGARLLLLFGLGAAPTAAAGPTIACDKGTVLRVDLQEEGGTRQWCLGEGGLGDGPVEERDADGALTLVGRLRAGQPVGTWHRPLPGGLRASGPMAPDGPTGQWQTRDPKAEEPLASVSFGRGRAPPPPLLTGPAPLRLRWAGGAPEAVVSAGDTVWVIGAEQALQVQPEDGQVLSAVSVLRPLLPELVGTPSGDLLGLSVGGEVFAVRDGRPIRLHTPKGSTHAAPADAALNDVVLRNGAGFIERRALDTGLLAWRSRLSMAALAPLVLAEAGLVVAGRDSALWALDLRTGEPRWSARLDSAVVALVVDAEGAPAALTARGGLVSFGPLDGQQRWRAEVPGAGRAALSAGADGLWVRYEDRLYGVALDDGAALLAPVSAPSGLRWSALGHSAAGERLCGSARSGGALRCAPVDGVELAWRAPAGALLRGGAPLSADLLWLRSGDDLLVIDPVEAALAQGLPELAVDEGEAQAVELVWWATRVPELAEVLYEGVVEAAEHRVLSAGDLACPDQAGALWSGPPPVADPETVPPEAIPAILTQLELSPPVGAGPLEPVAPWSATLLDEETTVHLWVPWWPVIESVVPAERDDRLALALDAALRCAGPPLSLRGEVALNDGQRRRLFAGRLELRPEVREVEGVTGCGLWVRYNGEPLGLWSAPGAPTWAPGRFVWADTGPDELSFSEAMPLPLGRIDGPAHVILLEPWGESSARTEVGGLIAMIEGGAELEAADDRDSATADDGPADDAPAVGADGDGDGDGEGDRQDGPARSLAWVLRPDGSVRAGAVPVLRLPIRGLALDLDPGEPATAALTHRERWQLEALAPLQAPGGAPVDALQAWPLWRRAGCEAAATGPATGPAAGTAALP
jgi:outer membrane protein assembly factor BamB